MDQDWLILSVLTVAAFMLAIYGYTRRSFARYSEVVAESGLTGEQVAREILNRCDLRDVAVVEAKDSILDSYDIRRRSVCLAPATSDSASIAAIGIAAHEAGHAQQAHDGVAGSLRVAVGLSELARWGGLLAVAMFCVGLLAAWSDLWMGGIGVFGAVMALSLFMLPFEMDASRRGLRSLEAGQYLNESELNGVRRVLRAAAWSYIAMAGATSVIAIRDFLRRSDDRP